MRVQMLVSLVEMPSFVSREEGTIHEVDDATARQWIATGLAVPVLERASAPETATITPGETAVMPDAKRKRG